MPKRKETPSLGRLEEARKEKEKSREILKAARAKKHKEAELEIKEVCR
jgi:hypothetical protein